MYDERYYFIKDHAIVLFYESDDTRIYWSEYKYLYSLAKISIKYPNKLRGPACFDTKMQLVVINITQLCCHTEEWEIWWYLCCMSSHDIV